MPATQVRFGLRGRVVTMDAAFSVMNDGVIWIEDHRVKAVQSHEMVPPIGFEHARVYDTQSTIYPGLIELHNHLSYNILRLWNVPKRYTNRDDWPRHPDYQRLVTGPMKILATTSGYTEAIVRFVECKCLLGGVTTSQGISLSSNEGIQRFYNGLVRNVEETLAAELPDAATRIGDVPATDINKFIARLKKSSCLLLHLAEGTDDRARAHFLSLQMAPGQFAITDALSGIHCVGLKPEDFDTLAQKGGHMIWSPLSNLLLYGQTADIKAAKQSGLLMGIGSDWSPSGSKNLLGELKAARAASHLAGGVFSDQEIVAMATCNAAKILKWEHSIGSLETGKLADLLVVGGKSGDPYAHLITAHEAAVKLVMIDGVARYGTSAAFDFLNTPPSESWTVRHKKRALNLTQASADPIVGALTLTAACDRLSDGLHRLPEIARQKANPAIVPAQRLAAPKWSLTLDHDEPAGVSIRPRFSATAARCCTSRISAELPIWAAKPDAEVVGPMTLDPITVDDDPDFIATLKKAINLPPIFADELVELLS